MLISTGLNIGSSFVGGGSDGIDVSENYRLNKALNAAAAEDIGMLLKATHRGARKAGYHPLYAIGQTPQPSKVSIAGQSESGSQWKDALSAGASGLSSWAEHKMMAPMREAQLQGQLAQNELWKSQAHAQNVETALALKDEIKKHEAGSIAAVAKQKPRASAPHAGYRKSQDNPVARGVDAAHEILEAARQEIDAIQNKALWDYATSDENLGWPNWVPERARKNYHKYWSK